MFFAQADMKYTFKERVIGTNYNIFFHIILLKINTISTFHKYQSNKFRRQPQQRAKYIISVPSQAFFIPCECRILTLWLQNVIIDIVIDNRSASCFEREEEFIPMIQVILLCP